MAVRACSTAQRRLCSPTLTSSTWARDNSATLPNLYAMNQVQAPGLRLEFPPLNTLDATPGNLRYPTTSFIGRDSELTELATALTEHRLLTLTGVGGVGRHDWRWKSPPARATTIPTVCLSSSWLT